MEWEGGHKTKHTGINLPNILRLQSYLFPIFFKIFLVLKVFKLLISSFLKRHFRTVGVAES